MTGGDSMEWGWPEKRCVYLTLDFECDYGTAFKENTYKALAHTDRLVELLEFFDIPLTCFIQTEVLSTKPEEVARLRDAANDISFHPHSHTHRLRDDTDVEAEVRQSTRMFEEFFDYSPTGYRLPNGNVRPSDYTVLSNHGYEFDASVFPSWRPRHFDNRDVPLEPSYLPKHDLFEIPFTVYSDSIRIPTALSYCRLLGRPFTELLLRRPPSTVVFNIHMHDLANVDSYSRLSPLYRGIYARNTDGFSLLRRFLTHFQSDGYRFGQLNDVFESIDAEKTGIPTGYSR